MYKLWSFKWDSVTKTDRDTLGTKDCDSFPTLISSRSWTDSFSWQYNGWHGANCSQPPRNFIVSNLPPNHRCVITKYLHTLSSLSSRRRTGDQHQHWPTFITLTLGRKRKEILMQTLYNCIETVYFVIFRNIIAFYVYSTFIWFIAQQRIGGSASGFFAEWSEL